MSQRSMSHRGMSRRETFDDYRDEVFDEESNSASYPHHRYDRYREHHKRHDSQGFQHTREQLRKIKYVNKQKLAEQSKLFIYNVSKKYTVDDIYYHLIETDINVIDLWQSSHRDARKKSFIVLIQNIDTKTIKSDRVLANLGIKVRDYEERKQSTY